MKASKLKKINFFLNYFNNLDKKDLLIIKQEIKEIKNLYPDNLEEDNFNFIKELNSKNEIDDISMEFIENLILIL